MLDEIKAFSFHPRFKILTRDQVDLIHATGIKVFPWTINTRQEAENLLALGVDGLICNDLLVARNLFNSRFLKTSIMLSCGKHL